MREDQLRFVINRRCWHWDKITIKNHFIEPINDPKDLWTIKAFNEIWKLCEKLK